MNHMTIVRKGIGLALLVVLAGSQAGCLMAVAGGAGAEAGYAAGQPNRTTGETVSDQWILTKVKSVLLAEEDVPSGHIDVDVFKGEVTLKGVLPSEKSKRAALRAAGRVKGVTKVSDKLFVVK